MKNTLGVALLLCSALGASALPDDPKRVPIGFIESIEGRVTLSPSGESLNNDTDRGRILFSGESLNCVSGAKVKGALLDGDKTVLASNLCTYKRKQEGADRVGARVQEAVNPVMAQNTDLRDGLLRMGRLAGRNKGSESPIFEPAPDAAILPETMVVHWRTRPPLETFTAVLQDASGKSLQQVPGVDGSAGVLDSSALRDALLKLRAGADGPVRAKLVLQVSSGTEYTSNFSVLSQREERELKAKLEQASAPGGLLAHVQRAGVFESYSLYGDVAAEYGRALDEAPRSRDLLRAAMDAYSRIGDLRHAREFRDRLDKVEGDSSK
jgi:hypothetical protein